LGFVVIYLLFFLSGLSGLIYQIVWVRVFGNVFGNTIYSASIVVAIFMLGLGAGSYVVGAWADRRYQAQPESLLRTYGHFEIAIAALGLAIALALPHLGAVSAALSSYVREPSGWYALSAGSYVARGAIALMLLAPITLLMGGTLTLLIRHLVRSDVETGGWRIALLYGLNTAGAALGALLTDFTLVPAVGLFGTQMVAVAFNVVAGAGAWHLSRLKPVPTTIKRAGSRAKNRSGGRLPPSRKASADHRSLGEGGQPAEEPTVTDNRAVVLTSLALAMIGLAALGMEILWFRHFTILLGGFRAVFSLLLTLILLGIGIGSLAGGAVHRRVGRPAALLMVVQTFFVVTTLLGLAAANVDAINSDPIGAPRAGPAAAVASAADLAGGFSELWFNAKPMLLEMALPALLMGFSFPLANAIIQRAERSVGRRAGVLYLANTVGAVAGSLITGFVLLPSLGLQQSATVLMVIAALAIVPLSFAAEPAKAGPYNQAMETGGQGVGAGFSRLVFAGAATAAVVALTVWVQLPSDFVVNRALSDPASGERRLVVDDGLTELIAVTEREGAGRTLHTNGHAMSSTLPLSQRYMRVLAHIPLLSIDQPEDVLVIGFGVGNTTHAATLHPTVRRVELADLSRDILAHASYFADANGNVLSNPKVAVHINDGRQHLQMQPADSYDLVVLEPPPIGYAGVSALYSREFYALVRSRLKPNGYISQWLPTYQVPNATALAMVRSFVDVFPQSVLLSGAEADLVLLGVNGDRIEIDPFRIESVLAQAPSLRTDLERVSFGTMHEIVGSFVGSARTLLAATRGVPPVLDDRPLQEYGVRSMLNFGHGVPESVVDLRSVGEWCPRCFVNGEPAGPAAQLTLHLELLTLAYAATPAQVAEARRLWESQGRRIAGSSYLGAIVPETAETYALLGLAHAQGGDLTSAIADFRHAIALEPNDAPVHWHLGAALAAQGADEEAFTHVARSVELDPNNPGALNDLGLMLAVRGRFDEAAAYLERALAIDPQRADARRTLAMVQQRRGR
jgi:spermidine synthase